MTLPLNTLDWIALAVFALCWAGYAAVVDRVPSIHARSVIAAMDEHRRRWMRMALQRDNRIADVSIIGNLMTSTSFLANTSIFILGGLVALLGAPELGERIFGSVPFAAVPGDAVAWEIRLFLLIFIFIRAFFELTWALRQFNYASTCLGALGYGPEWGAQADVAAEVASRGARHFNTGLRAYYFGLAALAWIVHPVALMLSSILVLSELHRREFRSVVRDALHVPPPPDSQ
ncbi:DUF599 domain-containing protein [Roseomonas marmotae]|uniref:DUF599 domain-containing protein n=1 Tax=Roseomonas marmotae TaxID=2768161 RepID=A0ABS3KAC8_9PROT|nr:DUF599 domain-containing protein [Roseomonas marmotae]MBO1074424.1 DUF599 domain-containing protein [Roseomonas marmotae]QTI78161.1 DUF599 domain-containing protein [Roseomonas marmotae]